MKLKITPVPAYNDNYIWVVDNGKDALVVDPGLAAPVKAFLKKQQLNLTSIIITHHHWDHINGVEELMTEWPCQVYGPFDERIPFVLNILKEGDTFHDDALNLKFHVIETPGHTLSHICYHNDDLLFCGDTLFSIGCGKMFEGNPQQYVKSLNKIKNLKENIKVYPTHEYTMSNLAFAKSLNYNADALNTKTNQVKELLSRCQASLPVQLGDEVKLNPFLLTNDQAFQRHLSQHFNQAITDQETCFSLLRTTKDNF